MGAGRAGPYTGSVPARGETNPELKAELEHQLVARYNDKLPLFTALSAAILLVAALVSLGMLIARNLDFDLEPPFHADDPWAWAFFASGVVTALLAWIIPTMDRRQRSSSSYGRLSAALFAMLVLAGWGILDAGDAVRAPAGTDGVGFALASFWLVGCFLLACCMLPWRTRTAGLAFALAAVGPIVNVAWFAVAREQAPSTAGGWAGITAVLCVVAAAPGLVVAGYRRSAWRRATEVGFFSGRYSSIQRDLIDARRIHEELFPKPVLEGPVRLDFAYEPMAQIGGDFLYVHRVPPAPRSRGDAGIPPPVGEGGALAFVLVDVTGHGVAAALTVTRMHGELLRIFGEEPEASPGRVLGLLNRYVALTMSKHAIYPTAVACRIEPGAGRLVFASAGHPPALILRRPGGIESLGSTSPLLGVLPPNAFEPNEREEMLFPGDRLLAYTDGPSDARDPSGRALRSEGVLRLVSSLVHEDRGRFPAKLVEAVARHRAGPPQDDTLVVVAELPTDDRSMVRRVRGATSTMIGRP